MKYEALTKYILNELEVGRRYIGYDYIVYGIYLMEMDKSCIGHITKSLYIDIANKYDTTSICVERSIRATIELIWNKTGNAALRLRIFGSSYQTHRPTNTQFFELLYEYLEKNGREECNEPCFFGGCRYCSRKRGDHTGVYGEKVAVHKIKNV